MSIEAMMWVKKHAPTEKPAEMCILYALADRANDDGTGCWPYYETLAEESRCSLPTVKRHVKELERRGLIKRGDQRLVSSYPKYRKPIVWDLNMSLRRDVKKDAQEVGGHSDTSLERGVNGDKAGYQSEQSEVSTGANRGITVDTDNPPTTPLQPSSNPPPPQPPKGEGDASAAEFDEWWSHVPRKKAKGDARKAFTAARKKASLDELVSGIEASKRQWQAEGRDATKIPYPATWLRSESWEDTADEWQVSPQQRGRQSSGNTLDAWMGTEQAAQQQLPQPDTSPFGGFIEHESVEDIPW